MLLHLRSGRAPEEVLLLTPLFRTCCLPSHPHRICMVLPHVVTLLGCQGRNECEECYLGRVEKTQAFCRADADSCLLGRGAGRDTHRVLGYPPCPCPAYWTPPGSPIPL